MIAYKIWSHIDQHLVKRQNPKKCNIKGDKDGPWYWGRSAHGSLGKNGKKPYHILNMHSWIEANAYPHTAPHSVTTRYGTLRIWRQILGRNNYVILPPKKNWTLASRLIDRHCKLIHHVLILYGKCPTLCLWMYLLEILASIIHLSP